MFNDINAAQFSTECKYAFLCQVCSLFCHRLNISFQGCNGQEPENKRWNAKIAPIDGARFVHCWRPRLFCCWWQRGKRWFSGIEFYTILAYNATRSKALPRITRPGRPGSVEVPKQSGSYLRVRNSTGKNLNKARKNDHFRLLFDTLSVFLTHKCDAE